VVVVVVVVVDVDDVVVEDVVVEDVVVEVVVVVVLGALVDGPDVVDAATVVLVRSSSSAESSPDPQAAAPIETRARIARFRACRRTTPRV
jgi:hypothetical protein